MTRETSQHVVLVEAVVAAIVADYRSVYSLVIYADLPSFGRDRPPKISGHVPDVFAIDAPETVRIIGEAKIPPDLETDRSRRQITSFLRHLSNFPHGRLLLSVPWYYQVRAKALVDGWAREIGATQVDTLIVASHPQGGR